MKSSRIGYRYLAKLTYTFLPFIIIGLIFSFIDSFSYTYVPMFIKYIISTLTNDGSAVNLPKFILNLFALGKTTKQVILFAGIGLFLYQFLRAALKVSMGYYRTYFGERVSLKIRKDLYHHIQNLSYDYHNNVDRGDLIQRCTSDIETVKNLLNRQFPEIVGVFSILIGSVYQMYYINSMLTLVSLVIVPLAFTSSFFYFLYVQKAYQKIEESEARLMTILQENLASVRVVKAFANESYEVNKFHDQNVDYAEQNLKLNRNSAIFWGLSDFTTFLQYLLTIGVAIAIVRNPSNSVKPSDIIAILMLVGSFIWPVRGLGRIIGDIGKSSVSAGRIYEVLSIKDEYVNDGTLMPEISGKITFDNVSFKFEDAEEHLLKGVSFEIQPGETVAFIGKTGSGKSTVAKLMTKMYDYQSGSIKIDGTELKDINKKHVRHHIGLILQDPFLFSKTVYDNIAITNKKIEQNRVYQVAELSAINRDIQGFEKGYETIVGERGATLSGGQKQRIAIARMLLEDKPILIFDDSLSALDTETDLMIRKALKNKESSSTMIIITHRITSAKQADKIIVLENGVVTQIGTHEELAYVDGLYKKLWDIQGELEAEFLKVLNEGR